MTVCSAGGAGIGQCEQQGHPARESGMEAKAGHPQGDARTQQPVDGHVIQLW